MEFSGSLTMILTGLKNANLALMFFLELGVLVALGYWGFQTGPTLLARIGLGIGVPVQAVLVWSQLGAPASARHLRGIPYLLLKIVFFGSAALALFAAGNHILALIFALIFILNSILILVWGQSPE